MSASLSARKSKWPSSPSAPRKSKGHHESDTTAIVLCADGQELRDSEQRVTLALGLVHCRSAEHTHTPVLLLSNHLPKRELVMADKREEKRRGCSRQRIEWRHPRWAVKGLHLDQAQWRARSDTRAGRHRVQGAPPPPPPPPSLLAPLCSRACSCSCPPVCAHDVPTPHTTRSDSGLVLQRMRYSK